MISDVLLDAIEDIERYDYSNHFKVKKCIKMMRETVKVLGKPISYLFCPKCCGALYCAGEMKGKVFYTCQSCNHQMNGTAKDFMRVKEKDLL